MFILCRIVMQLGTINRGRSGLPKQIFKLGPPSVSRKFLDLRGRRLPGSGSDASEFGVWFGKCRLSSEMHETDLSMCSLFIWGVIQFPGVIMMSKNLPSSTPLSQQLLTQACSHHKSRNRFCPRRMDRDQRRPWSLRYFEGYPS